MSSVIKVENLSKQYRLGEIGTGSLSHDVNRWWHRVRGKENPYLKIGEANDRASKGESDYVWSLKDINFEIEQGDAVGIIGRNGAGKSTLLKILSRVTGPTTGSVKVRGRIASLLEVGTGFHPELSGRDNIFLNGAILGMRKQEIQKKFDEIVDFSGVERYVDTPVKRYSSGMYVRLAFAVAAHLESEILIVDEVLAVGDAEFQKKCLGKMGNLSKGEGRTVLFVSHNMDAVRELTQRCLLLENGKLVLSAETNRVVQSYLSSSNSNFGTLVYDKTNWEVHNEAHLLGEIKFIKAALIETDNCFYHEGNSLSMNLTLQESGVNDFTGLSIGMRLMTLEDKPVGSWFCSPTIFVKKDQTKEIKLKIKSLDIAPGKYYFTIWIGVGDYIYYNKDMHAVGKIFQIEIIPRKGIGALPVWYPESWGNSIYKNLEII
jgi:lipopolysaccharide transport system ATP-binding protein